MAESKNSFSIIIPTYTGEEHIDKCFESLLNQRGAKAKYEVVVVIDGPNDSLRSVVNRAADKFKSLGIDFTIHQFEKNQGRFEARAQGAELARYPQLLFVDDRVALAEDFFKNVLAAPADILMPNVLEASQPNKLSRINYLLRRRIYGKKMWGTDFKSYYINAENFERSPKGTTSLWLPKNIFKKACEQLAEESKGKDNKYLSDDTRLLRIIIDYGHTILRDSRVKIFYNPRSKFTNEAAHLYKRGVFFVDYYTKKGSRFRSAIYAELAGLLLIAAGIIIFGQAFLINLALLVVVALIIASIYLTEKPQDFFDCIWVLPLSLLLFGLGVLKGLLIKLLKR